MPSEPAKRVAGLIAGRVGIGQERSWRLFWRYFRPQRGALVLYALGASLVSFLLVPVVWLVRLAFDTAIPGRDVATLCWIGLAIVAVRCVGTAATLGLRRWIVSIIKRAVTRLREDLLEKLYLTPREQLSRADVDLLQTRIVQDTERVDVMSNALMSAVLPALFSSLALAAVLFYFSWTLVLVSVLLLPVVWLVAAVTNRFVSRDVRRFQHAFEAFNKGISFVLRQMDLTRVQACEAEEIVRQKATLDELRTSGAKMSWSFAVHGQAQTMVTGVVGIGLLVLGGIEVMRGNLTLGAFLGFYFGAGLLNGFVATALQGSADVIAGSVSLAKLADLLEEGSPPAYAGRTAIGFKGGFTLRQVTFGYDRELVLRRVTLQVEPGAHVALIGANGAGKTTLLNLLLGLYAPAEGVLLADATPYADLDMRHLRRQIGVVLQRAGLFHGTIRRNIAYGNEAASDAALVQAATLAGAQRFIDALPAGYETEVGDTGVMLSGGEAQRLAIARALLRQPRALILDEPTNHLDIDAVGELLATLRALPDAPTIILVSHDERVIEFADTVYFLESGGVVRRDIMRASASTAIT
jgi:ATP-binding cassette, subfamily B, bacterial